MMPGFFDFFRGPRMGFGRPMPFPMPMPMQGRGCGMMPPVMPQMAFPGQDGKAQGRGYDMKQMPMQGRGCNMMPCQNQQDDEDEDEDEDEDDD